MLFLCIEGFFRLFFGSYIRETEPIFYPVATASEKVFYIVDRDGVKLYHTDIFPTKYYFRDNYNKGHDLVVDKTKNVFRVFVLGGSSTAGSPFGYFASFSRFLLDALQHQARTGVHVELVNLGVSGGSSTTARFLFERLAFLKPDLVIIYAGDNESYEGYPIVGRMRNLQLIQNTVTNIPSDNEGLINTIAAFADNNLYSFRYFAYKLMILRGSSRQRWFKVNPRKDLEQPTRDESSIRAMAERYEANLSKIILKANEVGAQVLLLSQPANYFHVPSDFQSISPNRRQLLTELGEKYRSGSDILLAASQLLGDDPNNPLAHYYLGLTKLNKGLNKEAIEHLELAQEYDRRHLRYCPSYDGILARLSGLHSNAHFLDIRGKIRELVPDGIMDGRIVIDTMHPTIELNRFIALKIASDFFEALNIRRDLFDYSVDVESIIYGPKPELGNYGLICKRYYNIEDWGDCLNFAVAKYTASSGPERVDSRRRALRVWENLFYFGVAHQDPTSIARGIDLVRPWVPPTVVNCSRRGDLVGQECSAALAVPPSAPLAASHTGQASAPGPATPSAPSEGPLQFR
jgi:tetratricopeptide (TPR) repeat protein